MTFSITPLLAPPPPPIPMSLAELEGLPEIAPNDIYIPDSINFPGLSDTEKLTNFKESLTNHIGCNLHDGFFNLFGIQPLSLDNSVELQKKLLLGKSTKQFGGRNRNGSIEELFQAYLLSIILENFDNLSDDQKRIILNSPTHNHQTSVGTLFKIHFNSDQMRNLLNPFVSKNPVSRKGFSRFLNEELRNIYVCKSKAEEKILQSQTLFNSTDPSIVKYSKFKLTDGYPKYNFDEKKLENLKAWIQFPCKWQKERESQAVLIGGLSILFGIYAMAASRLFDGNKTTRKRKPKKKLQVALKKTLQIGGLTGIISGAIWLMYVHKTPPPSLN